MKYLFTLVALVALAFNVSAQNVDVNVNGRGRANVKVRTNDNVAQVRVNSGPRLRPAVASVKVATAPARFVGGFYHNNTANIVLRNRAAFNHGYGTEAVILQNRARYNTQNVILRDRVEYVPTETVIVEEKTEAVTVEKEVAPQKIILRNTAPAVKRVILRNTATYGACGGVSQFSGGCGY
jgi:hypothetical protein